ncbi:type II toxin-antitoxin system YafQ family toxin [Capnocytophaga leadbetteri]
MSNDETEKEEKSFLLKYSTSFKKDLKVISNNTQKLQKTVEVLGMLQECGVEGIPRKMKPHKLIGQYKGALECHIEPDLLIIWEEYLDEKEISLLRLGSHSELFKK